MADATVKVTTSTQITHIGSGASIAPGAMSGSADISTALEVTGNLNRYPVCDVVLFIAPTASIASTSTNLYLYRRDLDVQSGNDEPVPNVSNKKHFMGTFQAGATTTAATSHHLQLCDVPLPGQGGCEFYLEDALGVNVPAGWALYVTPKSEVGATA